MDLALSQEQRGLLENERIGWLTTVHGDQPQSSPVWFLFDDGVVWVRSRPHTGKLRNLGSNDKVAFHLDSAGGANVVTMDGRAETVDEMPEPVLRAYVDKYDEAIRGRLRTSHEGFARDYSVTLRVLPTRVRAW